MIVNPYVDGYIETLNHRKCCGVLLTSNQFNMVLKVELSSKIFFCVQCCHWSNLLRYFCSSALHLWPVICIML